MTWPTLPDKRSDPPGARRSILAGVLTLAVAVLAACTPPAAPNTAAPPAAVAPSPAVVAPQPQQPAPAAQERAGTVSAEGGSREMGVQVVGAGLVLAAPDLARLVFGVERTDQLLDRVLTAAANDMDAVITRLVQLGVSRDEIKTVRFSVAPVYDNRGDQTVLRGYRVSNAASATIRDLGRVGPIIDAAVAAGASRIEGITFDTSRPAELKAQAREQAMADARAKAEQLARLAGAGLGPVLRIEESDAGGPIPVREAAVALAAPQAATPVEPGQLEIRTTVSVTWQLVSASSRP